MSSDRSVEAVRATGGGPPDGESLLRLAVISSPRSGNTWVREMLAALYGLHQIPVHFPNDIPWDDLPRRCIIQIHWMPEKDFTELLDLHGIRVVAVARHPFDVLLSFLNYAYYVHQEGICPGGGACDECRIVGATPRSEAVLKFMTGREGETLFGFTPAWWDLPDVMRVRYEDLVADAESTLQATVDRIGQPVRQRLADVVESNSIRRMKPNREVWQYHFWQGKPGLWRSMFPGAEAEYLASALREVFEVLQYPCDPDPTLDPLKADLNWLQLQLDSTREHLGLERKKHRAVIQEAEILGDRHRKAQQLVDEQAGLLSRTRSELAEARMRLQGELNAYQELRDDYARSEGELQAARRRLALVDELGPRAMQLALRSVRLYRKVKRKVANPMPLPPANSIPAPVLFRHQRGAANDQAMQPSDADRLF